MRNHTATRRLGGLASLLLVAAVAAACTTAGASLTPSSSLLPASTPTPTAGATSTVAGDTSTPAAGASSTPAATLASSTTAAPAATPAPRVAWVHGQTVKQDVLVAPGIGWVLTTTGLWQTLDDGASWANAYPHSLIAGAIRGFGAFDANHAMLAAVDVGHSTSTYYVWHTANAGQTWAYVALPPITHDIPDPCCVSGAGDPPAVFDMVDASTAFVAIAMHHGTDGLTNSVFETTNGGASWVARSYDATLLSAGPPPTTRVQFWTPTVGVAEAANEVSSTTTGWGHWTNELLPTDAYSTPAISFLSSTYWAADEGLQDGTVHYTYALSSDQGASWADHQSSVPGVANLTGVTVRVITPLIWIGTEMTTGSGYVPGPSTTIYTVDGGVHWVMDGSQPFNGAIATFIDSSHGWAGPNSLITTAKLYSTSDRGLTWHLLTP